MHTSKEWQRVSERERKPENRWWSSCFSASDQISRVFKEHTVRVKNKIRGGADRSDLSMCMSSLLSLFLETHTHRTHTQLTSCQMPSFSDFLILSHLKSEFHLCSTKKRKYESFSEACRQHWARVSELYVSLLYYQSRLSHSPKFPLCSLRLPSLMFCTTLLP